MLSDAIFGLIYEANRCHNRHQEREGHGIIVSTHGLDHQGSYKNSCNDDDNGNAGEDAGDRENAVLVALRAVLCARRRCRLGLTFGEHRDGGAE